MSSQVTLESAIAQVNDVLAQAGRWLLPASKRNSISRSSIAKASFATSRICLVNCPLPTVPRLAKSFMMPRPK